jgi:serine protease Do
MLKRLVVSTALFSCGILAGTGDTIQLKDSASVTGKILADKPDQVVVDLGYTVLVIPRQNIVGISKSDEAQPAKQSATSQPRVKHLPAKADKAKVDTNAIAIAKAGQRLESKGGLYYTSNRPQGERGVRELVNQLGEGVVQVRTPGGLGSGFIINEDGFMITNFHVIENETQISVEVYHQQSGQLERKVYKEVRIVAINKFEDLALLRIEDKDAPKFVRVALGDSDALAVGERVFAIGSPMALERTVTEGIVSTKTREIQGGLYLQTTAQINPGNSGGPLFNLAGEVVGVTNMKVMFGEGLGFAIPINLVKFFLDHRDAYAYSNDNPSNPYRYLDPPGKNRLGQDKDQE